MCMQLIIALQHGRWSSNAEVASASMVPSCKLRTVVARGYSLWNNASPNFQSCYFERAGALSVSKLIRLTVACTYMYLTPVTGVLFVQRAICVVHAKHICNWYFYTLTHTHTLIDTHTHTHTHRHTRQICTHTLHYITSHHNTTCAGLPHQPWRAVICIQARLGQWHHCGAH